nr:unnamed protein product [Digitaria exilis]
MGAGGGRTEAIMREIASLRAQRDELDGRIRFFEAQLRLRVGGAASQTSKPPPNLSTKLGAMGAHDANAGGGGLSVDMVRRYSRHLLLPDFGVQGSLGIADGENVELKNLHGQMTHIEAYIGQPKAKSAAATCRAINSSVKVLDHNLKLKAKSVLNVVRQYDIVVDATNSLASRYMLSDCCALLNKPLISGSTIGLEGQLTVYNHNGSPCYRCLFPNPTSCQSSSDKGILGVVPGVIGCLQALEVIKIATHVGEPLCGRMLNFDALTSRFKTVNKIHESSLSTCAVCGDNSNLTEDTFMMFDYERFTRASNSRKPLPSLNRLPRTSGVTCREYKRVLDSGRPHLLLDVRPVHHFQIASIANSVNIPLHELKRLPRLKDALSEVVDVSHGKHRPVYFISQCDDDSQVAVHILRENGFPYASDVIGGLESWAQEVDPDFPMYW